MNYKETIDYLFNSAPLFQNVGAGAYKEGLYNTHMLDEHFGHPHTQFRTIHVAGTNGKGSCSHTLAAILQASGLKVGLFTSPHLVDFRERIRVNGQMVSEDYVVQFVAQHRHFFEPLHPSFFELTTAMAFKYFAEQQVDIAVIEVGLGGRLDCTNIISPEVCVITNISFDHVKFLGDTLAKIAGEKAGIIKSGVPVVIGEVVDETRPVFADTARTVGAPIIFAEDSNETLSSTCDTGGGTLYTTMSFGSFRGELGGLCQTKNTNTILHTVRALRRRNIPIPDSAVHQGFANVCEMTGLMGRWQTVCESPKVVTDTGHNIGGFQWIVRQLADVLQHLNDDNTVEPSCDNTAEVTAQPHNREIQPSNSTTAQPHNLNSVKGELRIVFGMVNDKDISGVLCLMPKTATYYFTQASVQRALPCGEIQRIAARYGLIGDAYPTVAQAYEAVLTDASPNDFIYIGGSSFVVADFLSKK